MRNIENLVGPLVRRSELDEATAEIRRLRAKLKEAGSDPDEKDADEDEVGGGDEQSPGKPPKSKKKGKPKVGDEEDDEGNPAPDDAPKPDDEPDKRPPPPKEGSLSDYERSCKALASAIVLTGEQARGLAAPKKPTAAEMRITASNDSLLLAEVAAGYHPDPELAAQICAADRKARGQVSPSLPPRGSPSRMILEAFYASLGRKLEETTK